MITILHNNDKEDNDNTTKYTGNFSGFGWNTEYVSRNTIRRYSFTQF